MIAVGIADLNSYHDTTSTLLVTYDGKEARILLQGLAPVTACGHISAGKGSEWPSLPVLSSMVPPGGVAAYPSARRNAACRRILSFSQRASSACPSCFRCAASKAPCALSIACCLRSAPSPGQLLPSRAHARGARSKAARPASVIAQPRPAARLDLGEDFQTWHAGCQSGGAFRPIPPARCQNGYIALDIRNTREAVGVARLHLAGWSPESLLQAYAATRGQAAPSCPSLPNFPAGV
jgi:hypothetical protein